MLPSSSDLAYFVEISQAGNLTKAANRLGISQPSLSLAMQRLEQSVGTILLIRTRQGTKLTKAGERLLAETRQLLSRWDELRGHTLSTMNEVRGRFSIGCHPSVARYALPLFLPSLLVKFPDLEFSLHHDLSRSITQKVLALEIDLGIVVNPQQHLDLVMKSLAKDTVTLWSSRQPNAKDVLICEPSLAQTQTLMGKLKRQGLKFNRVIESSNLEVIASLARSGAGVGILPARVAQAESKELVVFEGAPTLRDEIFLVYRVENKNVRAIQALSESIQNGFAGR
jgi:LysR family transcriptional regulator, cell division regulator